MENELSSRVTFMLNLVLVPKDYRVLLLVPNNLYKLVISIGHCPSDSTVAKIKMYSRK